MLLIFIGDVPCWARWACVLPIELCQDLPQALNEILLTLLAKDTEARYQSAYGLTVDLRRCLEKYEGGGTIAAFDLGQHDFSNRWQMLDELFGRISETARLADAFERVRQGASEFVLIAGHSGVGKTSLVHELRETVAVEKGYFIEGKFDQIQRGVPYSGWSSLFGNLAEKWITEDRQRLEERRTAILAVVGESGQVWIEQIPGLGRIVGPQPPVPHLEPSASQRRFNLLIDRFIQQAGSPSQPLIFSSMTCNGLFQLR